MDGKGPADGQSEPNEQAEQQVVEVEVDTEILQGSEPPTSPEQERSDHARITKKKKKINKNNNNF